jgi:hypothetical protein
MRTFTTEAYVNVLEDLIRQFVDVRPVLAVSERIGQQLYTLGVGDDDPLIDRVANVMQDLFGDSSL